MHGQRFGCARSVGIPSLRQASALAAVPEGHDRLRDGPTYDRYGLGVFDQTNLANGFGVQAVGNGGWDVGGYSSALSSCRAKGSSSRS